MKRKIRFLVLILDIFTCLACAAESGENDRYVMPEIFFEPLDELDANIVFANDALHISLKGEGRFASPTIGSHRQVNNPSYLLTPGDSASCELSHNRKVELGFISSLGLRLHPRDHALSDALGDLLPRNSVALHVGFDNASIKHDIYLFRYCPNGYTQQLLAAVRKLNNDDRKGLFIGKWGDCVVVESHPFYPPYWLPPEQEELPTRGIAIDALDIIFASFEIVEFSKGCLEGNGNGQMFAIKYQLNEQNISAASYLAMDHDARVRPLQHAPYWLAILPVAEISKRCQYGQSHGGADAIGGAFNFSVSKTMRDDLTGFLGRRLRLPPERNVALIVLSGGGMGGWRVNKERAENGEPLLYTVNIRQPNVLAYLSADELARAEAIAKSGRISLKRHGECWLLTLPQYWEYWEPRLNQADSPVKPAKMERHLPNGKVERLSQ